ncbi:MAG: choice-of-anchor V domain-containing protein [Pseudomonadota bacterium]
MRFLGGVLASVAFAQNSIAYPEGAPWGSADPSAAENCASCHYDYEPVFDSKQLSIDGLPDKVAVGDAYPLTVTFESPDATVGGFQLLIRSNDMSAGAVDGNGVATLEIKGSSVRSTSPRKLTDDRVSWTIIWEPASATTPVDLYVAASAANDDQSPFGDQIHYRHYRLTAPHDD